MSLTSAVCHDELGLLGCAKDAAILPAPAQGCLSFFPPLSLPLSFLGLVWCFTCVRTLELQTAQLSRKRRKDQSSLKTPINKKKKSSEPDRMAVSPRCHQVVNSKPTCIVRCHAMYSTVPVT